MNFTNYQELKKHNQELVNALPLGCCFDNKQYEEMMTKWGLKTTDTDKIVSIGAGCYLQKKDVPLFEKTMQEISDNEKEYKQEYKKLVDMFVYELANHEYCITHDLTETMDACGVTKEDLKKNPTIKRALTRALKKYLKNVENL